MVCPIVCLVVCFFLLYFLLIRSLTNLDAQSSSPDPLRLTLTAWPSLSDEDNGDEDEDDEDGDNEDEGDEYEKI